MRGKAWLQVHNRRLGYVPVLGVGTSLPLPNHFFPFSTTLAIRRDPSFRGVAEERRFFTALALVTRCELSAGDCEDGDVDTLVFVAVTFRGERSLAEIVLGGELRTASSDMISEALFVMTGNLVW